MTSTSSFLSTSCHPTPAQLALALLVLKSKPIGSSVEGLTDHISLLRQCIQCGTSHSSRYLDSCAFWKQAYERSEGLQSSLLDEIYELKQQVKRVTDGSCQPKAAATAVAQAGVKRKRGVNPRAKQNTDSRRAYDDVEMRSEDASSILAGINIDAEAGEEIGGCLTRFARVFLEFRRYLMARGPHGDALALSLKRTCTVADDMLSKSIESSFPRSTNIKKAAEAAQPSFSGLVRVPHTLRVCYPSLLQAVGELSAEGGLMQTAVAAVVLLFQNVLGHLHAIVAMKAGTDIDNGKSVKQCGTRSTNQRSTSALKLDQMCIALTKLAVHFFEVLDLSQSSHNRVLEGLICVFLDHLGSCLSLVVFADAGAPKAGLLGVLPPCGLLDASGLNQKVAIRVCQHEACYLVTILRHLMLCIDKQQSLIRSESALPPKVKESLAKSNSAFMARVRERLHNTLLRGVFGDDDESFKDAFQRPVVNAAGEDFELASSGREEPGDWFIGEVWRLLGWNALKGRDGAYFGLAPADNRV